MSQIGAPPDLLWLPIKQLYVDWTYQRKIETPASQRLIKKIAEEFRWILFGSILAVEGGADKNGQMRWKIIDGQHRVEGARVRGGIEAVPGLVFADVSLADQAMAFVGANKNRIVVSTQAIFHAQLAAGDPQAIIMKRLCDKAGIELLRYSIGAALVSAGKTPAVSRLMVMLRQHGEAITGEGISAVGACYGKIQGALRSIVFEAAIRFLAAGNSRTMLETGLRRLGPDGIAELSYGITTNSAIPIIIENLGGVTDAKRAAIADPANKPREAHIDADDRAGSASEVNARLSGGSASPAPITAVRPIAKPVPVRAPPAAPPPIRSAPKAEPGKLAAGAEVLREIKEKAYPILLAAGYQLAQIDGRQMVDGTALSAAEVFDLANKSLKEAGLPSIKPAALV